MEIKGTGVLLFFYLQDRKSTPVRLPVAEIDFSNFSEGIYPIVGYRTKWDRNSFEYHRTPRKFPQKLPRALLKRIETTALESFHLLMLRDDGRVDIRVDGSGRIHVLEVNANPCLSPDAGFVAAAQKAGIGYPDLVSGMVGFMLRRTTEDDNKASIVLQ